MARPTLFTHPKFLRLSMALGSRMMAAGALECVWRLGYESGDPFVGDWRVVEYACEWKGEPGALSAALVDSGFLDGGDGGRLSIHDLHDHAPEYVQKRFAREASRKESGATIASLRSEAGKKGAAARWDGKRMANGGHCLANGRQAMAPPTPAPTPTPAPKKNRDSRDAPAGANGHTAVAMFCEAFKGRHGTRPSDPAIDRASKDLKALMAQHGQAVFGAALSAYFASKKPYVLESRHDPKYFATHFDEFSITS